MNDSPQNPQPESGPAGTTPPDAGPASTTPPGSGGTYADFRSRYTRPKNGKVLAGVCAGIARATNTDPLLWRVLFVVFALFAGVGVVAYVAGWLFLAEEGDSASPAEALFGRGQSSTSAALAIVLGVVLVVSTLTLIGSTDVPVAILLGVLIIGIVYLAERRGGRPGSPGWAFPPHPPQPAGSAMPQAAPPFAPHGPYAMGVGAPAAPTGTGAPRHQPSSEADTVWLPGGTPPGTPQGTPPAGTPLGTPPGTPPPPPWVQQQRPPKPPREKSLLGRLTFFVALASVGVVAILDLLERHTGLSVPAAAYFAVPLAVVGLGLLVGTIRGRAYWLIALGVVLAIGLGITTAASVAEPALRDVEMAIRDRDARTWTPQSVEMIRSEYRIRLGDGTVDFREVNFSEHTVTTDIRCEFCNVQVLVPPQVDVEIHPEQIVGAANLLGTSVESSNADTVRADGEGPGSGKLIINMYVRFGYAEVSR